MYMKDCINVYERIATGEIPSRLVYKNLEHGLMVLLDPMPAAEGHLAIATLACAPSVDALASPKLHNKMSTVAKYAGRVLSEAFPNAPYIGELTASNQIRHPHIHRLPGDEDANWAKRFSKLPDWPRLKFTAEQMDDLQGRLSAQGVIPELWEECNAEVIALGAPDEATRQAVTELGIVLT
jgi:diadenosine tetraphosphate (Ap4A) HIT family hydrolase